MKARQKKKIAKKAFVNKGCAGYGRCSDINCHGSCLGDDSRSWMTQINNPYPK